MSATIDTMRKLIAPVANRLRLTVSRGVVNLVDNSFKMQALQVELHEEELHDEVERFEEYGLTSTPAPGAEVLFLSVGGNRSAGVVVCVTDRRYRPKDLAPGDVCLYTRLGERVYLEEATDIVHLGAKAAADFLAKQAETKANDDALKANADALRTALNAWVPVAMDGGAALKAAIAAWLASSIVVSEVKTTKVKGT